jgi:hypothetical protein
MSMLSSPVPRCRSPPLPPPPPPPPNVFTGDLVFRGAAAAAAAPRALPLTPRSKVPLLRDSGLYVNAPEPRCDALSVDSSLRRRRLGLRLRLRLLMRLRLRSCRFRFLCSFFFFFFFFDDLLFFFFLSSSSDDDDDDDGERRRRRSEDEREREREPERDRAPLRDGDGECNIALLFQLIGTQCEGVSVCRSVAGRVLDESRFWVVAADTTTSHQSTR